MISVRETGYNYSLAFTYDAIAWSQETRGGGRTAGWTPPPDWQNPFFDLRF